MSTKPICELFPASEGRAANIAVRNNDPARPNEKYDAKPPQRPGMRVRKYRASIQLCGPANTNTAMVETPIGADEAINAQLTTTSAGIASMTTGADSAVIALSGISLCPVDADIRIVPVHFVKVGAEFRYLRLGRIRVTSCPPCWISIMIVDCVVGGSPAAALDFPGDKKVDSTRIVRSRTHPMSAASRFF